MRDNKEELIFSMTGKTEDVYEKASDCQAKRYLKEWLNKEPKQYLSVHFRDSYVKYQGDGKSSIYIFDDLREFTNNRDFKWLPKETIFKTTAKYLFKEHMKYNYPAIRKPTKGWYFKNKRLIAISPIIDGVKTYMILAIAERVS